MPLKIKSIRAFTMVEALVIVLIGSFMMITINFMLSQGVRSSLKGQDQLETIRAASSVFSQLRKDLLACDSIDTDGVEKVVSETDTLLNLPSSLPQKVSFFARNATTTYSILAKPRGKCLLRVVYDSLGNISTSGEYAVPRMKNFEAIKIVKVQQVKTGSPKFVQSQLFIRIALESNDPRISTSTVNLSSFFVTSQLSSTQWWNYHYPPPDN
ncbi:MAG: hypothetical protein HQM08_01710 [Candidatus Riflebacteria bacterium]|nr:hypothetical protein [Candidatus Riflebacteria bacterium]